MFRNETFQTNSIPKLHAQYIMLLYRYRAKTAEQCYYLETQIRKFRYGLCSYLGKNGSAVALESILFLLWSGP